MLNAETAHTARDLSAQTVPIEDLENPKVKILIDYRFVVEDGVEFPQDAPVV